jgi:hypothetical protein
MGSLIGGFYFDQTFERPLFTSSCSRARFRLVRGR